MMSTAAVLVASSSRTFAVLAAKLDSLLTALGLLAKRAQRKGLTPIAFTVGKAYLDEKGEPRVDVTLTGDAPKFGGWSFAATLEHLGADGNIVRSVPGHILPPGYRTRGPVCDHCHTNRLRADTFVLVHENGRYMQVGSTCLGDFLGSDKADSLANAATYWAEVAALLEDEDMGCGMGGSRVRMLREYLAFSAREVRENGWVSRTKARENGDDLRCTAEFAWNVMIEPKGNYPAAEDTYMADKAEEWAEGLTDETINAESGDYLHNLRAIARRGLVDYRAAGLAASIIVAYQRAVAKANRVQHEACSTYVGTVGKRETFKATLDFVTGYATDFGYTTVLKFRTPEGACLVWKASSTDLARDDVGKTFSIVGTVKAHTEYKGAKQTMINRCKVAPM